MEKMKQQTIRAHAALIIVDMQNDFCAGGALEVPNADTIIPLINHLASRYQYVVATKDWHPPNHISFASSHSGAAEQPSTQWWPVHCVQESKGAELHPALAKRLIHYVVHKGYHSDHDDYSAFAGGGLAGLLKGIRAQEVIICGIATDYCVLHTVLDACDAGFDVAVYTDAVCGLDQPKGNVDKAFSLMKEHGVKLIRSQK